MSVPTPPPVRSFTDSLGREWAVSITMADVRPVKLATEVDLGRLVGDSVKPLADLMEDPCRVCDVVFVLCRRQANERGVDAERFAEGLDGDSLEAATIALGFAVADFLPSRLRLPVIELLKKGVAALSLSDQKCEALLRAIEKITPEQLLGMAD